MHALSTPALELAHRAAGLLGLRPAAAALHGLVRLVLTVWVPVTAPQGRDALGVVAAELVLVAAGSRAFFLITGISTVIIPVTDEDGCQTLSVATLEVFGRAGLGI